MFSVKQVASMVNVPLYVSSFAGSSSLFFLRMDEQNYLYHHPYDLEDTHLRPSASLLKCVCGKESGCLHQTEFLTKSPIKYCRYGSNIRAKIIETIKLTI